jgi:hypothetical protein
LYYLYNDYKINAKEIVVIIEEFSFSRNTKIMININNEVSLSFSAPDQEYLEAMVNRRFETYLLKGFRKKEYFIQLNI